MTVIDARGLFRVLCTDRGSGFGLARSVRVSNASARCQNWRSQRCLAAALQLGFIRLTGTTLEASDYVLRSVLGVTSIKGFFRTLRIRVGYPI
jgi:hypothetical protein